MAKTPIDSKVDVIIPPAILGAFSSLRSQKCVLLINVASPFAVDGSVIQRGIED
jgi:hypothetical protein